MPKGPIRTIHGFFIHTYVITFSQKNTIKYFKFILFYKLYLFKKEKLVILITLIPIKLFCIPYDLYYYKCDCYYFYFLFKKNSVSIIFRRYETFIYSFIAI